MRCRVPLMLGLLLAAVAGCASPVKEIASVRSKFRSLWCGLGPDAIQLEIALVQQPLDDPYLGRDVWREVDEQVLPLNRRPVLEANGFRLGTISGAVPSGLQRLLTGARLTCIQGHKWEVSGIENDPGAPGPACPHCQLRAVNRESFVTARRKGMKPNDPFFLPLGPDKPLKIKVDQEGSTSDVDAKSAQAGLHIQLSLSEGGEVVIRCEPRIQHGAHLRMPHPSADKDSWSFTTGRSEKEFAKLAWEIRLEPNEYLVVGAWPEHTETLGQRCFLQADTSTQTLLVIRTARPQADAKQTGLATKETKPGSGPLPLALQSIMPRKTPQPPLTRGQSADRFSP